MDSPLDLSLKSGVGRRVLVTGATGYVGGRLIPELLAAGFTVRALARNVDDLANRAWFDQVETVQADLQQPQEVRAALQDVHTMLYLVHSMGSDQDFEQREAAIARGVADAAADTGVEQIVFLSGLHPDKPPQELSAHMRSREHVAQILLQSEVPTLVFEAAVVIGSGSVSFEMIRHLTERLPIMPGPSWLANQIEPIAIRDVLYYLAQACALDDPVNRTYDIALLIADPPGGLTSFREASRRAIDRQRTGPLDTTWDDDVLTAMASDPADPLPSDPEWSGHTVLTDERQREGSADAAAVWQIIESIGGRNGWYSASLLWRIRGLMDQALGGYGLARGRKNETTLQVNDHVDWWRVESVEPGHAVTLRSEMRTGGRAWLQFSVDSKDSGGSRLRQRAIFFPSGVVGRAYWRLIQPFHALIFPTMAKNILQAAQRRDPHTTSATHKSGELTLPASRE